tara:strand:- start:430 stop:669 length:240 start_codon:yes stop_codon:yes gene_type:complete
MIHGIRCSEGNEAADVRIRKEIATQLRTLADNIERSQSFVRLEYEWDVHEAEYNSETIARYTGRRRATLTWREGVSDKQ